MTPEEERIDKVLDSLSKARTALDDPAGLDEDDHRSWEEGPDNLFAIDMIDDAMRLLSPEKSEPEFGLMVSVNGVFVSRRFDPEEEAIDAIGEALERKSANSDDVVTIVVGLAN